MKTLCTLAWATPLLSGKAHAYTLEVTSCNWTYSGIIDTDSQDSVTFSFCEGGSYCEVETAVVSLPPSTDIDVDGATIQVPVSPGFVPTTMEISNQGADAWCISEVVWEGGDNLLGQDGYLYLDSETSYQGCFWGVHETEAAPCQGTWRFFDVDNSGDYEYDVRVTACAGTSSSSVRAYFCSNSACDTTTGDEQLVELTMSGLDGGSTDTSFALSFNPLAVRLEEMDDTWCAEDVSFNGFSLLSANTDDFTTDVDGERSIIIQNLQANGMSTVDDETTSVGSDDSEDDDTAGAAGSETASWLDAAWEVAVTVVGAMVVAAGAACGSFLWRRNRANHRQTEGSAGSCRRPVAHDLPPEHSNTVGDAGWAKEREEPPLR